MALPLRLPVLEVLREGEEAFAKNHPHPALVLLAAPEETPEGSSASSQFHTASVSLTPRATNAEELWLAPLTKRAGATGGMIWLGRHDSCDITLPYPLISKAHCGIRQENTDAFVIIDAGSRNGTHVDGKALKANAPTQMRLGAELVVGDVRTLLLDAAGIFLHLRRRT